MRMASALLAEQAGSGCLLRLDQHVAGGGGAPRVNPDVGHDQAHDDRAGQCPEACYPHAGLTSVVVLLELGLPLELGAICSGSKLSTAARLKPHAVAVAAMRAGSYWPTTARIAKNPAEPSSVPGTGR